METVETISHIKDMDSMICINCIKYAKNQQKCEYHPEQKIREGSVCSLFQQKEGLPVKPVNLAALDKYMENARAYSVNNPYFYDKAGIFWMWNHTKHCYCETDETDLIRIFDTAFQLEGITIKNTVKTSYVEAFKRVGREQHPQEAPERWVQFKDKAFSLRSGRIHDVTPDFFFTNPIPWRIANSEDTPVMDKLIREWVGEEYLPTMYELIAYCCYRKYPIQVLFCLYGAGRNGKTCFLKLLQKFLGQANVCSTELDLIAGNQKSRFETYKMYRKLVTIMGETNFSMLASSSLIKKLTGGDVIGFEKKGKDGFDAESYAKIIIASNSLPSSQDTSDGFYRRWIIVPFTHEFPEGKDITETVPDEEYECLARKVIGIIQNLLSKGIFVRQGSIQERKDAYIMASNPLPMFLKRFCVRSPASFILQSKLYSAYVAYLLANKKRKVTFKEFKGSLEDEGLWADKTSKKVMGSEGYEEFLSGWWIIGVDLVPELKFCSNYDNFHYFPTPKLEVYRGVGNSAQLEQVEQNQPKTASNVVEWLKINGAVEEEVLVAAFPMELIEHLIKIGELYRSRPGLVSLLP